MDTEEKLDLILSELGEVRTHVAVIQNQLKNLPCSAQIAKVEGLEKELGEVKSDLKAAKFVGKIVAGALSFAVAVLEFFKR